MCSRLLTSISLLLLFSGCALHPVPEDVTGVDTYHIVRQIRCESRNAVIEFIQRQLRRQAELQGDPIAQRLLLQYESDPESIRSFSPNLFPGPDYIEYRHFYNQIYSAAIAYNFDLTMTEQNDLGTTINLLGPWKNKFTMGTTGNFNRQRTNQRTFTISDTFAFLLANLNRSDETGVLYCDGQIVQANYIYPIAGRIGVYKTVKTFFELTVLGGLAADKAKPGAERGAPTMVDNLKFTTTVDLNGTPKVLFASVGAALQVMDASVTGLARRTDFHQVTVGLAVMPTGLVDAGLLQGFLFPGPSVAQRSGGAVRAAAGGSVVVGNRVIGASRTAAERLAISAIDQVKSREIQLIPAP